MKDHSEENSMVTGLQYEESFEMPTPEFIRSIPQQVKHEFPLTTRLQAAINQIHDGNVDMGVVVSLLNEAIVTINISNTNFKELSNGIDTFLANIDALKVKEQAE